MLHIQDRIFNNSEGWIALYSPVLLKKLMSADFHNVHDQIVFPELDSCTLLLKMPLWKNMICFLTIHSFSSVTQSCPTLCDPMDCSTPGFPVHHQFPDLAQTHVHESVMPSNHLILLYIYNYPSIEFLYVFSLQFSSAIHSVICWGTPLQSISPEVRRPHFCPGSIFAKWPWLSHSFWSLSLCRSRKGGPTEVFESEYELHALEKEMATHSSVVAWRIPGTAEPDGLPSMGLHRVGHDWSDLAAAAAAAAYYF